MPHPGSSVIIDTLRFLPGCRKRQLNQVVSVLYLSMFFIVLLFIRAAFYVLLVTLVRLPGTHSLTASSSSRTLVDLNSFSSLIYFVLLFDILLAPLENL